MKNCLTLFRITDLIVSKVEVSRWISIILFIFLWNPIAQGQSAIPRPDHTVIVMFENKSYTQILGSSSAPFIHSLTADTNAAVFTQSFALTHPSQPNYLMLFSGSNQGVTTDSIFPGTPFTTCNLGSSLIQGGFTFTGYCEDMPSTGFLGSASGLYKRKHNPWSNWQGTSTNNLSPAANQPFSAFPTNYNSLPDVSFVIPNMDNCMHNGSIGLGDSWLQSNLNNYRQWALANNSLLILTFDEDDGSEGNRILTLFYGPMIKGGSYNTPIDHYDVLRTLEDIYHLSYCGGSASAHTIDYVWKSNIGIQEKPSLMTAMKLFPNPARDHVHLSVSSWESIHKAHITVTDLCGKALSVTEAELSAGENRIELNHTLATGVYCVKITSETVQACTMLVVE